MEMRFARLSPTSVKQERNDIVIRSSQRCKMEFTYTGYQNLIQSLLHSNYEIVNYHNWKNKEKCAILRHDVDEDLGMAVKMAECEQSIGVQSTFFIMLTNDYYNVFSRESFNHIRDIIRCGHEIGLHFDEVRYPELSNNIEEIKNRILDECSVLGSAINAPVTTVSMHRPSKMVLASDLKIPGIVNSYGYDFFKGFKYVSDSRRCWREPVEEIIASGDYCRLHILTHAFWYHEKEKDMQESRV